MEELSPRTIVERSIQSWWFIVLTMLAGGLTAYLIHTARPPVYEAKAVFSVSLDYTLTGKIDLTEEDIALSTAAKLITSAPVVEQVIAAARAENLPVDAAYINQHSRFERKSEAWELAVRDLDPEVAARVVNLWAPAGIKMLDGASLHAQKAAALREYIASLSDCLQRSPAASEGGVLCAGSSLAGLQTELASSGAALQEEIASSWGLTRQYGMQFCNRQKCQPNQPAWAPIP